MIKFRCQACNKKVGAPDRAVGKRVACPSCGQTIPVPEPEPAEYDPLMPDLDALKPTVEKGPPNQQAAGRTCPSCRKPVGAGAALCVACGEPLVPGVQRPTTEVATEGGGRSGSGIASSVVGLIVAGIAAGVFSVLWVGLAIFTGYEFGVLAWGLGGLIGLIAGAIAKNASPIFGGLTALLALGSILGAKFIMAGMLFLTAFGVSFLEGLDAYSPEGQRIYHAVLDQMIEEGAFVDEQLEAAQVSVDAYFSGDYSQYDVFDTAWEQHWEATEAVEAAVAERIESMSEEDQAAAIDRARERYPEWIEDHNLYLAVVDEMVEEGALPGDLERHAQSELAALNGAAYDDEYFQTTAPRQRENRDRELRGLAASRIAEMSPEAKEAAIEAARQRHPRWIVDERLHYAVLSQVVDEAILSGAVQEVAEADVASTMEQAWDQPAYDRYGWERMDELRGEATVVVNERVGQMSEQQRSEAIAEAEAAYPEWGYGLGFDTNEVRQALDQEGVDGSFGSALRATFSFFDALWIFLAVTTAFSVAVKQGE